MWGIMKDPCVSFCCLVSRLVLSRQLLSLSMLRLLVLAAAGLAITPLPAQDSSRIPEKVDLAQIRPLPNHHPLWANPQNDAGLVTSQISLTLVIARSPEQQAAFEQLLADQQNPASPDYHHWLTPVEIGERFGLSDADLEAVKGWIESQGMRVNWVAPSRAFIAFGGPAPNVGRAFQTEIHNYRVNGADRISVSSDPMIPAAITPVVAAIHGFYTIDDRPAHFMGTPQVANPQITLSNGMHFVGPGDFNKIYDLPSSVSGNGITIGIVGRSRTNAADFDNFKALVGPGFADPTEVVPTAYGGVDPGPAYTAPPSSGVSIGEQGEATLDVLRAGSVAYGAHLHAK